MSILTLIVLSSRCLSLTIPSIPANSLLHKFKQHFFRLHLNNNKFLFVLFLKITHQNAMKKEHAISLHSDYSIFYYYYMYLFLHIVSEMFSMKIFNFLIKFEELHE